MMRAKSGLWFTTSLLLLLILPLATLQNQTCYFPNQGVADLDIPCTDFTTSDGFVFCCGSGRTCLPEGICSSASGDPYLSRGSCTDQSWSSPSCPQYCTQSNNQTGEPVANCTSQEDPGVVGTDGDPTYCCGGKTCCSDTGNLFTLIADYENSTATSSSSSTDVSSSTSTASALASSDKSASISATGTTSSKAYLTVTVTASAQPSATSGAIASSSIGSATASPSSDSHKGLGIGVGLGIGIPLLIALIAGPLLWRRRHRRHNNQSRNEWQVQESAPEYTSEDNKRHLIPPSSANESPIELDTVPTPRELDGSGDWISRAARKSATRLAKDGDGDKKSLSSHFSVER